MTTHTNKEITALFNQGAVFERHGNIEGARAVYKRIITLDKRNVDAIVLLGLMEIRSGYPFEAIRHFEKALKINKNSPDLYNNLAMLFLHLGRADKALFYAEKSYKINKKSTETLKILFKSNYELGRSKKAQEFINEALSIQPEDANLKLDLALCYDTSGEPEKAHALFKELINSGYPSVNAYDGLARTKKFTDEPTEYKQIKELLSSEGVPKEDLHWLSRAAGKIADDLGYYDEAFEYFSASKSQQNIHQDIQISLDRISLLKEIITPEFFLKRKGYGLNTKRPVFVFGMPRSGTTLVEQVLSSLPGVYGANELLFFRNEEKRLQLNTDDREVFMTHLKKLTKTESKIIAQDYLKLLAAYSSDALRVIDKMPFNFETLWFMALLFPDATFIHCRRNPVATCTSIFMRPVKDGMPLAELGKYYRQYHELMEHWRTVLPVTILDVDYEAHVQDPEVQARKLVAHVGLDWDDRCLRFHEIKRDVRTPSRRQVEQPIYTHALESWRRYEKHLQPLLDSLGDLA